MYCMSSRTIIVCGMYFLSWACDMISKSLYLVSLTAGAFTAVLRGLVIMQLTFLRFFFQYLSKVLWSVYAYKLCSVNYTTDNPLKISVFWDITPYSTAKVNRRFAGTYHLHLVDQRVSQSNQPVRIKAVLIWLLFDSKDGGDMFLWNVC
jgi:hypothetical protein